MSRSPVACQAEDLELARCGGDNLCGCAHIRYSKAIVDFRRTTAAATRACVPVLVHFPAWLPFRRCGTRYALFASYRIWLVLAHFPEEKRQQEELPSPEKCVSEFLTHLREEIRRL